MLSLLLLASFAFAGSKADLDSKYGFRDLKFGSAATSNSVLVEDDGAFKCYHRPSDALSIGDAALSELTYCYYNNELGTVIVKTDGISNSQAFLAVLNAAYGDGYQSNKYIEKYYWWGELVTLSYDRNSITDDSIVIMSSKSIRKKQSDDKRATAEKAAEGL